MRLVLSFVAAILVVASVKASDLNPDPENVEQEPKFQLHEYIAYDALSYLYPDFDPADVQEKMPSEAEREDPFEVQFIASQLLHRQNQMEKVKAKELAHYKNWTCGDKKLPK